jgi:sugar lactone lactonase YvrE
MMVRLLAVATLSLVLVSGCSQATAPMPQGTAQTASSNFARQVVGALPKLHFFNTPTQGAWPDYIISGPQGALWFSEFYTDKIGRIATGGRITEFPLPDNNDIEGIAAGPDGNIWFTEPGAQQIGRMTPAGQVTAFQINGSNPSPRGITAGPDGNIWYVEFYDSFIGRVTPSGTITRFQIPGPSSFPWDITTGPDGDLWFTESADNAIGRFDPRTLQFKTSLSVPTPTSNPWGILLTPDKHIWFTERTGDKLAVVLGSTIKEFRIAQSGSYPEKIAAGSDGNLWFTEMQAGRVGHFNPVTGKFGPVITLPKGSIPIGIASGPDKNLWFCIASYTSQSQIGKIVLH